MADTLPTFADLQRRYASGSRAISRPDERDHLIGYLARRGATVSSATDVYQAVLSLPNEEELAALRCREGVAVSHASDGWWLLFRDGDTIDIASVKAMGAGAC